MNKKWKVTIIATAVLLLAGTLAFAQDGSSPQTGGNSRTDGEQKGYFTLGEQAYYCGGYSGGSYGSGGYGGNGGGNGNGSGNGGGFSCH